MTDLGPDGTDEVILDGKPYDFARDRDGTRRFVPNRALLHLRDLGLVDGERARAVADGLPPHDLAEVLAGLGWEVGELLRIPTFAGWDAIDDGYHFDSGLPETRVNIGGADHDLVERDDGRLYFHGNAVLRGLVDPVTLDLAALDGACRDGAFDDRDYLALLVMLGLSFVDAMARPAFRGWSMADDEGNGLALPDRAFLCVHAEPERDLYPAREALGLRSLGDAVLHDTPPGKGDHAPLHAYMQRRFGFPSGDGDPHKDMCGSWCLTTPDPDLFLIVSPGPGPRFTNLSPYLAPFPGVDCEAHPIVLPPGRAAAMREAYRTALADLLRPVPVDDHWLTALGEVERGTPLMDPTPDGRSHTFEAPCDPGSTKGVPPGLAGTRDWDELMTLLRYLGDGVEAAGLARVVEQGRGIVMAEVRAAPANVRTLVAAGAWGPYRDKVWEGLELDAEGERAARAVASAFLQMAPPDAPEPVLPDFTEAETVEATRLLSALAIDAPMTESWHRYLHTRRMRREYEAFTELAGNTPPDALHAYGGFRAPGGYCALPGELRGAGATALADHVERLLADPEGHEYLGLVLPAYLSGVRSARP